MSRIQEILKKAERDGGMQRTRGLNNEGPSMGSGGAALAEPPRLAPAALTPPPAAMPAAAAAQVRHAIAAEIDPRLVAAHAPQSPAGEQYRSLRTRIKNAENGRPLRAIIVTSPNKGDGKSLTAANLALTMAQEFQQRVLLLDADLRRPAVHRLFGLPSTSGLSTVLAGGGVVEDSLVTLPEHRLTILPAGPIPMHPAELLGSAPMRRLIDTLRTGFDRILIDM